MSAGGQFNKPPSGGGMGGGMFGSGGAGMQQPMPFQPPAFGSQQPMPAMQQQGMGQSSGLLSSLGQGFPQQTGNQQFGANPQFQGLGGFFNQYNSNPPPGMVLNPEYAPRAPGDNTRDYRPTDQMFRPAVMPPIDNGFGLMPMPFTGGTTRKLPPMGGIPRPMPMPAPFMPTISDETGQVTPPQVMRPDVMPPQVSDETGQFTPPQVIRPSFSTAPSGPPAIMSAIENTRNDLRRKGSQFNRFPRFASRRSTSGPLG